jgi:hypothetical protein
MLSSDLAASMPLSIGHSCALLESTEVKLVRAHLWDRMQSTTLHLGQRDYLTMAVHDNVMLFRARLLIIFTFSVYLGEIKASSC